MSAPDGADLLDCVRRFLARFVAFPSSAALDAVTLWAAHAHLVDASDNSPRLALLSPEPGSGKTRTLEVLDLLVPRPMHALNAAVAPIFRSIEAERPTLLFDEVDAIFGRHGRDDPAEDLRGLLNAGHRKGASVPRCVGPSHDVKRFPVYAAAALAGLGDLPDTLMSRSIIVRMRRRAPGERIDPFRRREHGPDGTELCEQLIEWAESVHNEVRDAWPDLPDGIVDRPADVWEPLLAIADAAGGHWPDTGRAACTELAKIAASREASLSVRLLADLRDIFGEGESVWTHDLLDRLHKIDEAPWADLRGKPLDARGLARRLRPYEVRPVDVFIDGTNRKGYRREDLHDPWTRYLSALDGDNGKPLVDLPVPSDTSARSARSANAQVSGAEPLAHGDGLADRSASDSPSASATGALTCGLADLALLAHLPEGTPPRQPAAWLCVACSGLLDGVLVAEGAYTHPMCDLVVAS